MMVSGANFTLFLRVEHGQGGKQLGTGLLQSDGREAEKVIQPKCGGSLVTVSIMWSNVDQKRGVTEQAEKAFGAMSIAMERVEIMSVRAKSCA